MKNETTVVEAKKDLVATVYYEIDGKSYAVSTKFNAEIGDKVYLTTLPPGAVFRGVSVDPVL